MTRYNIVGYYPQLNDWCLIGLGNTNKDEMKNRLNEIKNNPTAYGINPNEVTDYRLEPVVNDNNWWDKFDF